MTTLLETRVREGETEYTLAVYEPLPEIYSELIIVNGSVTTVEGSERAKTARLMLEMQRRGRLGDVSRRWYGKRVNINDVFSYLGVSASPGKRVEMTSEDGRPVVLFTDRQDYDAENLAAVMPYMGSGGDVPGPDFTAAAAEFSRKNKHAPGSAVFLYKGSVYDHTGRKIGFVGDASRLEGLSVFDTKGDESHLRRARQDSFYLFSLVPRVQEKTC